MHYYRKKKLGLIFPDSKSYLVLGDNIFVTDNQMNFIYNVFFKIIKL